MNCPECGRDCDEVWGYDICRYCGWVDEGFRAALEQRHEKSSIVGTCVLLVAIVLIVAFAVSKFF